MRKKGGKKGGRKKLFAAAQTVTNWVFEAVFKEKPAMGSTAFSIRPTTGKKNEQGQDGKRDVSKGKRGRDRSAVSSEKVY